ncbi:MAG: fluoride efflux transporter CrcB [Comamonadaceae bacterium]|nr:MAG: fluoride efflux transporter CrcB [Comamonadaceae bacterium]
MLATLLAVCAAACAGTLLRWGIALWLNPGGLLPWGTLAVNLVGGYLIGLALGVLDGLPQADPAWRAMVVTGFLGSFTTFSSFSAETVGMLSAGRTGLALATIALHVAGSLGLTWLGFETVRWLAR